jgi:hypothetical protein
MLPAPTGDGLVLDHSAAAGASLLADLRSDRGMAWVPDTAWLTKVRIDAQAGGLRYDLAVDASGQGTPSRVAAGLDPVPPVGIPDPLGAAMVAVVGLGVVGGTSLSISRRRSARDAATG